MPLVAEWCNSPIKITSGGEKYISVSVKNPINEGQTQAFVGRWVLYSASGGYKVYTDHAFCASFEPFNEDTTDNVQSPDEDQPQAV